MNTDPLRTLIFVLFFTSVIALMQYYIWKRLVSDPEIARPWRNILTVLVIVSGFLVVAAMFAPQIIGPDKARLLVFGPLVWQGASMLFLFTLLAIDVGRLIHLLYLRTIRRTAAQPDPERRQFIRRLIAGTTALAVTGISGTAVAIGNRSPRVIHREIRLRRFPSSMNGLRVVQLSDIHVGLTITRQWLEAVVEQVNELAADIVVITGDLVDGSVKLLAPHVAPLADLKATHGVFFVTGNHEYYSDAFAWTAHLKTLGIRVLQNERTQIGTDDDFFYLVGVNDYTAGGFAAEERPDLDKALRGKNDDAEVVLLAHQPREIENVRRHDVGLMLSGHTHGGQIWPFSLLVGLQQPYKRGLYLDPCGTQVYVNQGTGLWGPPMRLGSESEITLFTLMRETTS